MGLFKDPLIHFLGVGMALFLVSWWWDGGNAGGVDEPPTIHLTAVELRHLSRSWADANGREPNGDEFDQLIRDRVREEVLYREGVALGLAEGDAVIRARVAEQVELMNDLGADLAEPGMGALRAYYDANREDFAASAKVHFRQLFFDPAGAGGSAVERAERQLAQMAAGDPRASGGDPSPGVPQTVIGVPRMVAERFGDDFYQAVSSVPVGRWMGPVRSRYGVHLVHVIEREDRQVRPFYEVVDEVREAVAQERRAAARAAFYERARTRYRVVVEDPRRAAQ